MFKKAFIKSFLKTFSFGVDQLNYRLFYPMTQFVGEKLEGTSYHYIGRIITQMIEEMNKAGTPTDHLVGQLCWYIKMVDKTRLSEPMAVQAEKYEVFMESWMNTVKQNLDLHMENN